MNINSLNDKLAVITTNEILSKDSPVVAVVMDEDGDLQFIGKSGADEVNARVISLAQMLNIDNTLRHLPELSPDKRFERTQVGDSWRTASR